MNGEYETSPVHPDDIELFLGVPFPLTVQGLKFVSDDQIVCIAGVVRTPLLMAYMDHVSDARELVSDRAILGMIKEYREFLKEHFRETTVYAIADYAEGGNPPALLKRAGFEQMVGDIYMWRDK